MSRPEPILHGPNGQPIQPKRSNEDLDKIKTELETMVKDKAVELYGSALVAGYRLNAWGHHYIALMEKYSEDARRLYHNTVMLGLIEPSTGKPRAFNEASMLGHLHELIPMVDADIKNRVDAAKEKAAADSATKTDSKPEAVKPEVKT